VWDSTPPALINNELRRVPLASATDHFGVMFDTFTTGGGFIFYTNPLGALSDYSSSTKDRSTRRNPVWTSHPRSSRRLERDAVRSSLRYYWVRTRSGLPAAPRFGKNEFGLSHAGAAPRLRTLTDSSGGTIVDLDLPAASKNVELKPYAGARVSTDRLRTPPLENDFDRDFGGDARYGVTANLTADLTVNTDFAQVEVDEQQVNLTRFSLFFPEKRDFFLEGRGGPIRAVAAPRPAQVHRRVR
jgi:hypothetical protein